MQSVHQQLVRVIMNRMNVLHVIKRIFEVICVNMFCLFVLPLFSDWLEVLGKLGGGGGGGSRLNQRSFPTGVRAIIFKFFDNMGFKIIPSIG